MMARRTTLRAQDLPDDLKPLRSAIEAAVPHGRTNNGGPGDRGAWGNVPYKLTLGVATMFDELLVLKNKHPKLENRGTYRTEVHHLGTLGTGNHFIELCLDEHDFVWIMLHSGSRGIGNRIGTYFISQAQELMEKFFIELPNRDLAYLPEGTELMKDYITAVEWAQEYAQLNRRLMMKAVEDVIHDFFPEVFICQPGALNAVECHHNYVTRENHFGKNVYLTRKGAVCARQGIYGIIPGSMGAKSFIVRGLGNPDSFDSCSHGAGRVMSRTEAKRQLTLADHERDTAGVECRKDADVIDESPKAYKNIDDVMKSQADLVEIMYTLKQVLCVKG